MLTNLDLDIASGMAVNAYKKCYAVNGQLFVLAFDGERDQPVMYLPQGLSLTLGLICFEVSVKLPMTEQILKNVWNHD